MANEKNLSNYPQPPQQRLKLWFLPYVLYFLIPIIITIIIPIISYIEEARWGSGFLDLKLDYFIILIIWPICLFGFIIHYIIKRYLIKKVDAIYSIVTFFISIFLGSIITTTIFVILYNYIGDI